MALPADRGHIFRQCCAYIDACSRILSKPIIRIGKIAAVSCLQPLLCYMPFHQRKVALMLGADAPRGIAHMSNG